MITKKPNEIKVLAPKTPSKVIAPGQASLPLSIEKDAEIAGIGMGVLTDGTPYLNQRGLASLCDVQNSQIGEISLQWLDDVTRPRVKRIKEILASVGYSSPNAHIEVTYKGTVHYCYPAEVCLAILEYYAFDAGNNSQPKARDNFRLLAGSKLRELIYSQVGYDPTGKNPKQFDKWHERIALNYQSAPRGFFHVFNEAHTVIYELILAGAAVGEKMVVDISIGQHWSAHWADNNLAAQFSERRRWPHRYPESHPQSKSNPQDSWCYPLAALPEYRRWLQETYLEGGKFATYLHGKVKRGDLPPSVAQLAISTVVPPQISGPPAGAT